MFHSVGRIFSHSTILLAERNFLFFHNFSFCYSAGSMQTFIFVFFSFCHSGGRTNFYFFCDFSICHSVGRMKLVFGNFSFCYSANRTTFIIFHSVIFPIISYFAILLAEWKLPPFVIFYSAHRTIFSFFRDFTFCHAAGKQFEPESH